jgi:hypothetical protein
VQDPRLAQSIVIHGDQSSIVSFPIESKPHQYDSTGVLAVHEDDNRFKSQIDRDETDTTGNTKAMMLLSSDITGDIMKSSIVSKSKDVHTVAKESLGSSLGRNYIDRLKEMKHIFKSKSPEDEGVSLSGSQSHLPFI